MPPRCSLIEDNKVGYVEAVLLVAIERPFSPRDEIKFVFDPLPRDGTEATEAKESARLPRDIAVLAEMKAGKDPAHFIFERHRTFCALVTLHARSGERGALNVREYRHARIVRV